MTTTSKKHMPLDSLFQTLILLWFCALTHSVWAGSPTAANDQTFHQGGIALAVDVLANDSEPDGEATEIHSLATTCAIQAGSLKSDFGLVTLVPAVGTPETCVITYRLRDETNNNSATATVTVSAPSDLIFRDDAELGNNSRWDNYVE